MPGSSAHADASLLLHRYGIVDFASHPHGKEAKFSLKETSSHCGQSQPTKSKLPSRFITKNNHSEAKKKEIDIDRARFQDLREEEKKNWRIIVDESNRIDGRLIEKKVQDNER